MYPERTDAYMTARNRMVGMLKTVGGIYATGVLRAMESVPRHLFISEALRYHAYQDTSLPIGFNQTISKPSTVARMLQSLELTGCERVLEIGTGSGYQTALLAQLASSVVSSEGVDELHKRAREILLFKLGITNATLLHTFDFDGIDGTFDAIIVSAGAGEFPGSLLDKLNTLGRMVIPVGRDGRQVLKRFFRKNGETLIEDEIGHAAFVPLVCAIP